MKKTTRGSSLPSAQARKAIIGGGSCTVTVVERSALERVKAAIAQRFEARFGTVPQFFATQACEGVREEPTLLEASQNNLNGFRPALILNKYTVVDGGYK